MARGETYEEFAEKFKPKHTTDDCYTPPKVYKAVNVSASYIRGANAAYFRDDATVSDVLEEWKKA